MKNTSRKVDLTLSRFDRELIRKHGYPFPEIEAAINAVPSSTDVAVVSCDAYYVELLLGDLARSINSCNSSRLVERLDELYTGIEADARI